MGFSPLKMCREIKSAIGTAHRVIKFDTDMNRAYGTQLKAQGLFNGLYQSEIVNSLMYSLRRLFFAYSLREMYWAVL